MSQLIKEYEPLLLNVLNPEHLKLVVSDNGDRVNRFHLLGASHDDIECYDRLWKKVASQMIWLQDSKDWLPSEQLSRRIRAGGGHACSKICLIWASREGGVYTAYPNEEGYSLERSWASLESDVSLSGFTEQVSSLKIKELLLCRIKSYVDQEISQQRKSPLFTKLMTESIERVKNIQAVVSRNQKIRLPTGKKHKDKQYALSRLLTQQIRALQEAEYHLLALFDNG